MWDENRFQGRFESRGDGVRGALQARAREEFRDTWSQRNFGLGENLRALDLRKKIPRGKGDNLNSGQGASKLDENSKSFRCTEVGHHQLNCTNEPVCYNCKQTGHMAAECARIH